MKYKIGILLVLAFAFLFTSCEKDPTSLGSDLLPPDDFIDLISVNSTTENWLQSSKSFQGEKLNIGRSQRLLLGKHAGITSDLLIRTVTIIPDSIFKALQADSLNVLSAWFSFIPVYTWGDTNSTFGLSAYSINEEWQFDYFDIDSLNNLDYNNVDLVSQVQSSDSLLRFQIEPGEVQSWLKARVDSTTRKNYGLLLVPAASNNKILGFPASNGPIFGPAPSLKIVVEKPGDFIDTLTTNIIQEDAHVIDGNYSAPGSDKILLQSGVLGRGYLRFDLSSIPPNSIINNADIELHIDSLLTEFGKPPSDSIEIALFLDSLNFQVIDSTVRPKFMIRKGNKYTGEIHTLIQLIINGKPNAGLRLKLTDEERSVDKIVLDGSSISALANKPKITVLYTAIKQR